MSYRLEVPKIVLFTTYVHADAILYISDGISYNCSAP